MKSRSRLSTRLTPAQERIQNAITRGLAYEKKGDTAKAEEDFAKAKELGYEPE